MQLLQFADPTGLRMVARVPSAGTVVIALGSELIVEESQQAVLLKNGRGLDVFAPGRHALTAATLPRVARLMGPSIEADSSLRAAVVFVYTTPFELKWGTREPLSCRDRDVVGLRAYGEFAIRVVDSGTFVSEIVGRQGLVATDAIEAFLRDGIVSRLADLLDEELESVLDLPRLAGELAARLGTQVAADWSAYGIALDDLRVGAIRPGAAATRRLAAQSGRGPKAAPLKTYRQSMAARAPNRAPGTAAPKPAACSECGEVSIDGAAFCAFCGTQLSA